MTWLKAYRGLDKLVIDALLDKDPGAGAADLALVEQDAQLEAVQARSQSQSSKKILALLPPSSRVEGMSLSAQLGHIQAHFGGAGESQLPEAGDGPAYTGRHAPPPVTTFSTPGGSR